MKDSGIDEISLSPEGKKDRIIQALKQILLKGSGIRPVLMAVEDLHWVDKSSEEALKYTLDSIPCARVQLIFTYRPEFVHAWAGRSYHNQINLNRLSNRESLFMVSHLLGIPEIDKDLEKLILEKTEGVPFFIEELLKSLKDLKIIERKNSSYQLATGVKAVAVPSTIQDTIMARVDSLPDAARAVLQTGSVIEREFSYELIKRATGVPEQSLLTHLSQLKDSELIYERGIYPQTSYIFRHALTREVVYDSILANKKKELHEKIGREIEELYRNSLPEQYAALADHFYRSESYGKAAEYLRLAGKKAEKSASFTDGIFNAKKRIACLERLPQTEEVQKEITHASATLGLYFIQLNCAAKAKEAVDPVVNIALRLNHKHSLAQIHSILGHYEYVVEEDFDKAMSHFEEALKFSEETKDVLSLFFTNYCLGFALMWNCTFEQASHHFGKALEINVDANDLLAKMNISSQKIGPTQERFHR